MESRRDLPDAAFIPTRIVVANDIVEHLDGVPSPTPALRELTVEIRPVPMSLDIGTG